MKSFGVRKDYDEQVFKLALEELIDKIRVGTGGTADICLLSGVPRLLPNSVASAGIVEKIVNGVKGAALDKKTAFVDTFETYLHLTPEQKAIYYLDTVHPRPAGQEFIGSLIFDKFRAEIGGTK